jgi:hypothetical protein
MADCWTLAASRSKTRRGYRISPFGGRATACFRINQIQTIQTATFGRSSFFPSVFDPGASLTKSRTRPRAIRLTPLVHHLTRAMVLLDASAIARNVGRHLVFLRFHTRVRSHTRFWGRKHDGRWGQKTRYPRLSKTVVSISRPCRLH